MEQTKRISEFLEPEEIKKLLECPDRRSLRGKRDYAILRFLLETGLRKSELRSLRYSNIQNFNGTKILIVKCLKKRKLKGKDGFRDKALYREIPLNESLVFAVERYRDAHGLSHDDYLFHTITSGCYRSRPLTTKAVDIVCRNYLSAAKIEKRITPHSFRRSFATNVLRNGGDLATVRELLGHEHISSTQCYLLTSYKHKRTAVEGVDYGLT
ncbi:site-specific integrase [bacterium]|nr:site-specific integrase [bacterium]